MQPSMLHSVKHGSVDGSTDTDLYRRSVENALAEVRRVRGVEEERMAATVALFEKELAESLGGIETRFMQQVRAAGDGTDRSPACCRPHASLYCPCLDGYGPPASLPYSFSKALHTDLHECHNGKHSSRVSVKLLHEGDHLAVGVGGPSAYAEQQQE
eukprot:159820-Chlamydomonas_euryale.AAC.7